MAFELMEWINKVTKLNKTTMDEFQNNIKSEFDNVNTTISELNSEKIKKGIATLKLATNQTTVSGDNVSEQVKLDTASIIGSNLIFKNNSVKIGKGISHVLVSAAISLVWNSPASGNALIIIFKNGNEVVRVNGSKTVANMSVGIIAPPYLVDVAEGDVISLGFYGANRFNHQCR